MNDIKHKIDIESAVYVCIPGLAAFLQHAEQSSSQDNRYEQVTKDSVLFKLIKSSHTSTVDKDYCSLIYGLFGYNVQTDTPVAALRFSENNNSKTFHFCADPVYLQPDRDQLIMYDSDDLQIQNEEAQSIIATLNSHFEADGLIFTVLDSQRWQMQVNANYTVNTTALNQVVNRSMADVLPTGDNGKHWQAISNEIQMLLFSHEVNDKRQERGLNPINGLWLWGAGFVPESSTVSGNITQVVTDQQWLSHLANINNIPCNQKEAKSILSAQSLYLDTTLSTEYGKLNEQQWLEWLETANRELFSELYRMLKTKSVSQLKLYAGDGACYTVKSDSLSSFWRKLWIRIFR